MEGSGGIGRDFEDGLVAGGLVAVRLKAWRNGDAFADCFADAFVRGAGSVGLALLEPKEAQPTS